MTHPSSTSSIAAAPGSPSRQRQATVLRGLGVLFVVGALGLSSAAHALVASDQQRIDNLQVQLTRTLVEQQGLQLSRAELESPARVLRIAEGQLGMVAPASVYYLAPVDPGPSVAQAGATAARAALGETRTRKPASTRTSASTGTRSPTIASRTG